MKNKKLIKLISLMILMSNNASALNEFKVPKFSDAWKTLPDDLTSLILKVLALVVGVIIAIILANAAIGSGEVSIGRMGKDTKHTSGGMGRIIRSVVGVVAFLAGVILILWFVG